MELCEKCLYGRKAAIGRTTITYPDGTQEVLNRDGATAYFCDYPWAADIIRDECTCSKFTEKGEKSHDI